MDPGNGSADVPDDLVKRLQNADVTTIVDDVKAFASGMFDQMAPSITHDIGEGIDKGINGVGEALSAVDNQRADLEQALETLGSAAPPATSAGAEALQGALSTLRDQMQGMEDSVPAALEGAKQDYLRQIDERAAGIEDAFQKTLNDGFRGLFLLVAACSAVGLVLLAFYRNEGAKA